MSRGDQSNIDAMCAATSQPFEFLFLQNPQKLRLQCERYVTKFIEKECSLVGQFEAANLLRDRAGKSTAFVTEEFAFEQIERNGSAVELDEGLAAARTGIVNRVRNELFAGSGLSLNKDSRIGSCDAFDLFQYRS